MQLTTDQQKAYDEIVLNVFERKREHVLQGYAGTGKTFLCKAIAAKAKKPLLVTPTNKAAQVLSHATGLPAMTIHKALGLVLKQGKLMSSGADKTVDADLIIVDEVSMIGRYLWDLMRERGFSRKPVLYVGDPAQLPPVKETESPAFNFPKERTSYLTEIVRQQGGNPIIGYSKKLRMGNFDIDSIPFDDKHIINIPVTFDKAVAMTRRLYDEGLGVATGWRNATVDAINDAVFKLNYPDEKRDYAPGQEIIMQEPLLCPTTNEVLLNNSDTTSIADISPAKLYDQSGYFGDSTFDVWDITTFEGYKLKTLQKSSKQEFWAKLDTYRSGDRMDRYWQLREKVTEIKHPYAVTTHKLQGATVDTILVLAHDIAANPNREEARRCMYVAVTRASNKVGFLI